MHFDFVDIGTCDFDTSVGPAGKILLVEPLDFYLDKLPNYPNVIKDNVGISNVHSQLDIYYLPEDTITKYDFPFYARGCSSVGRRHPAVDWLINDRGLGLDLVKTKQVELITFEMLCLRHGITSIGSLKIDTEGHEQFILPDVLKKIKQGMKIGTIKFENQEYLGNKPFLDHLVTEFIAVGYELLQQTEMDVTLRFASVA